MTAYSLGYYYGSHGYPYCNPYAPWDQCYKVFMVGYDDGLTDWALGA